MKQLFRWVLFILKRQVQSAEPVVLAKYHWKSIPYGDGSFSKYVANLPHRKMSRTKGAMRLLVSVC